MVKPKYNHDCDKCVFLGNWAEHDLYWCSQNGFPTVISRHGNEPDAYTSGIDVAKTNALPSLAEAFKRAKYKGLVHGD